MIQTRPCEQNSFFTLITPEFMTGERRERPLDPGPRPPSPAERESGPRRPETGSPDKDNLLKRMRKVDPKQAERYRQRTGE